MKKLTNHTVIFAAVLATAAVANNASACSTTKTLTAPPSAATQALLAKVAPLPKAHTSKPDDLGAGNYSIVGMWYVQFSSAGQVVDIGLDSWHADGSEVLNDISAPATGNICLGVWTQTGPLTYQLNHPAWVFDDANVNVVGMAFFSETVTLDGGGTSYSGKVTISIYDFSGNLLQSLSGDLSATRITPEGNQTQEGIPLVPATPGK